MTSHPYDQPIRDITNYIHNHPITDPEAYTAARIALLDALGCAIETVSKSHSARQLLGPFIPGTTVPNGFKVPGTAYQVDPVKGAFDLGVLIRYLDHNDALGGREWGHPSDTIPALLSITDYLSRSDTRPTITLHTLLTSLIKSYEIQGHYQLHNAFNTHNIDHVILVKLSSTAIVSYLLGHTPETTQALLSHVWMDGHPSRLYRGKETTVPRKGWAAGDASSRAVQLCLLGDKAGEAMRGVPGALSARPGGFGRGGFLWGFGFRRMIVVVLEGDMGLRLLRGRLFKRDG
ncbi:2-methylcitrate dehydratase PrpD [Aspergillus sclerotioniger CBS 115572]|uniref:2-methylcitrate dehydratase PrpD n=1 Tax=Aspergillus sclerotioniger CBS 115572 TaxID=1450535 RepID=A0A317WWD3_9EURO|nr:2-methylcitrate dehydratase PrpD [Aspergillus sclerotioniger CBS 115572]PWY89487.1 2-methylcitrate dehydratase PrpD [Aspergillus sclerotioniger CBS 115572]